MDRRWGAKLAAPTPHLCGSAPRGNRLIRGRRRLVVLLVLPATLVQYEDAAEQHRDTAAKYRSGRVQGLKLTPGRAVAGPLRSPACVMPVTPNIRPPVSIKTPRIRENIPYFSSSTAPYCFYIGTICDCDVLKPMSASNDGQRLISTKLAKISRISVSSRIRTSLTAIVAQFCHHAKKFSDSRNRRCAAREFAIERRNVHYDSLGIAP